MNRSIILATSLIAAVILASVVILSSVSIGSLSRTTSTSGSTSQDSTSIISTTAPIMETTQTSTVGVNPNNYIPPTTSTMTTTVPTSTSSQTTVQITTSSSSTATSSASISSTNTSSASLSTASTPTASTSSTTTSITSTSSTTSATTTIVTSTASGSSGSGSITVLGETLNGTSQVNGIEVDLRVDGTDVAIGNTPITFSNLQFGVQYGVVVYWYGSYYIRYINDQNTGIDLQRYDTVTLNQSAPSDTLTGMFEYVPPSEAASLNIIAEYPNGTQIGSAAVVNGYDLHSSGMWLTVTPPFQSEPYTGTFTGGSILPFIFFNHETYTVQMSTASCGEEQNINGQNIGDVENVWSHWENGSSTNPTMSITLNGNATLIAIYNQVSPPSCGDSTSAPSNSTVHMTPEAFGFIALIVITPAFLGPQRTFRNRENVFSGLL